MAERLAATAKKKRDAKEVEERKRLSSLERVKRYDNGDKYEGAVMLKSGQIIPDGEVKQTTIQKRVFFYHILS